MVKPKNKSCQEWRLYRKGRQFAGPFCLFKIACLCLSVSPGFGAMACRSTWIGRIDIISFKNACLSTVNCLTGCIEPLGRVGQISKMVDRQFRRVMAYGTEEIFFVCVYMLRMFSWIITVVLRIYPIRSSLTMTSRAIYVHIPRW